MCNSQECLCKWQLHMGYAQDMPNIVYPARFGQEQTLAGEAVETGCGCGCKAACSMASSERGSSTTDTSTSGGTAPPGNVRTAAAHFDQLKMSF